MCAKSDDIPQHDLRMMQRTACVSVEARTSDHKVAHMMCHKFVYLNSGIEIVQDCSFILSQCFKVLKISVHFVFGIQDFH